MNRGKLITLEGTEGAGKSTAMQFIQAYLSAAQIAVRTTREPGGSLIAEEIRQVLLHSSAAEKIVPQTELLLMFASRAQHIQHTIIPALNSGQWVLSDRYIDASYAYQGGGRQVTMQEIALLDQLVVQQLYPDLTLLFDVPAQQGFARTENRQQGKDRIEQEKIDFFIRVREAYLARAAQDPARIKIIDASQSLPVVQAQIAQTLAEFLRSVHA